MVCNRTLFKIVLTIYCYLDVEVLVSYEFMVNGLVCV